MSFKMLFSPARIASPSSSEMIPCLASMAAWAMDPSISSRYRRLSTDTEALNSFTSRSVSFLNRPAHIFAITVSSLFQ